MTTNSEQKRLTEKFVGKLVCSTCTFPRLWNYSATTSTEILVAGFIRFGWLIHPNTKLTLLCPANSNDVL